MRVMLVQPGFADIYGTYRHVYKKGFANIPLAHCYLAASLAEAGHEPAIVDAEGESLLLSQVVDRARHFQPGLIGLSATSVDFAPALATAKALKAAMPHIPLILGGIHINIFKQEVLEKALVFDFGCVGDGEDLIVELVAALSQGEASDLNKVAGLIHRDKDGQVIRNPDRPYNREIDRYPFPRRDLIKNELYIRSVPYQGLRTTASFISGRGCPYSCVYCAIDTVHNANKVRLRSASNVLDELEIIVKQMGIRHIAFNDDVVTLKKKRMLEICQGIHQRGLKFTWEGLTRADLVDKEVLQAMHGAGLVRLSYGIESGNQGILDILKKRETLEEIQEAIRITHEVGIVTQGSVILGSPGETRQTVKETLDFLNRLDLDQAVINIMQPYPGTQVREMFIRGEGGGRMTTPPGDGVVEFQELRRFGNAVISVNDLSPEDLISLQKWGFFRFYARPSRLWRTIRLNGLGQFIRQGVAFVRALIGR